MPDKTVARWLKALRAEGSVELLGDAARSRNVRYRRTAKLMLDEET
ncbi:hypothetical protein [Amycolatopsis taiwanensis]|nr:hypothetical protein [Amycolatopsis taiwanensis]